MSNIEEYNQEIRISDLKDSILELPLFHETKTISAYDAVYALLELANEITPDVYFLREALEEVIHHSSKEQSL